MSSISIPRHTYCAALAAAMLLAASAGECAQPTPGQASSAAVAKPLPFVSTLFGDNMVLQRGKPDTIWGWSEPGGKVRVQIGDNVAAGTAGPRSPVAGEDSAACARWTLYREDHRPSKR